MEHKTKAWIITGLLIFALLTWALVAVHDSAVANARAARANKSNDEQGGGCPFSKAPATTGEAKKKSCCHSKTAETAETSSKDSESKVKAMKSLAAKQFEKFADLDDADMEEIMKQFTPEQLAKCPHLKARNANKKKK